MSALADLVQRLRALVFRRREERELDEELRFHVDMEAERLQRAGVAPSAARRLGAIALGGIERTKEDVRDARGTRWLEDLIADFSYGLRGLRHNPAFTVVALVTLAIGVGGTTAMFSAVNAVLIKPLPYRQPGQLVRLYQYSLGHDDPTTAVGFVTPVHYLAYRADVAGFESLAALRTYSELGADIGSGDKARRIRLLPVSGDYFGVVGVQPVIGRAFNRREEDGTHSVLLSHGLWEQEFQGDSAIVGRVLRMSGVPYTVAGLMPAGFADPVVGAVDAWIPADLREGSDPQQATNHYLTVIGRLRSGVTIARAQSELNALGVTLAQQFPNAMDMRARLVPLKDDLVGGASRALEIMLGAVALVLMLVRVNIANLLLVRGSHRARELALRSALGAERERIARQLLTESLVLAVGGAIGGLVVARLAMGAIVALGAGAIPRLTGLSVDPLLLAFAILVASGSAIVFGALPAVRAARTDPADVLRDQTRSATSGAALGRLRSSLVIGQVATALVLLVGAGLLVTSFRRLREVNLGVTTSNILSFGLDLPAARYDSVARAAFYEEFANRVEHLPGVRAAGGVSKLAATGDYHVWGVEPLSGPRAGTPRNGQAQNRVVSGDYFRAVGIPILSGRTFDARDNAAGPSRVIVSTSIAERLFPGIDPLGQRLTTGSDTADVIIGVVPDVAVNAEGTMDGYVYHAHRQYARERTWSLTQVVAVETTPAQVIPEIRQLISSMDPELVMDRPTTYADVVGRGVAQRAFTLRILGTFALLALGLATLGLFGVLSYTVALRRHEFGIRMALGAKRLVIAKQVARYGLALTVVGVVIGGAGSIAASRLMASLVFQVSPLDPRVIAGAIALLGVVAASAALIPAYRATRADPLEVIRSQ